MYDHQTESLWLQVKRKSVTGPMTGTRLKTLPSTVTTWKKWKKRFPDTMVLNLNTGYERDYSRDPYENYYKSRGSPFGRIFKVGPGEEEKELVAGIELAGSRKAYPIDLIREKTTLKDHLGGKKILLNYDHQTDILEVRTMEGKDLHPIIVYWFVWKEIYPDTEKYAGP